MKHYLAVLILTLIIAGSACSQVNNKVENRLSEKVPVWLTEYDVPAAGIGIIENGEIKFVKVFGELQKGIPAPENTIFSIASITKTFVTMLTLNLVEAGQWKLDEPLSIYWVDPDITNDPMCKKLTTRHVLTHQTGFVNWRWNHPTKKLTFDFEPGTKYQYSGEGFEYLRKALENKFKKPLEILLDSIIFKPLGMKDTRYWDKNIDMLRYSHWHDYNGKEYKTSYQTGISAADLLLTTIEDYCKFGVYLVNGAGISAPLYNDMVTPQSNIQEYNAIGLGWFIVKGLPNGEYAIQHSGSDYGAKTIAVFLPKSKRGIVVFTNGDNGMALYNNVIKESFDIGNKVYEYLYYRPNIPEIVSIPDTIIEKYSGRYQQPDGSINLISKRGNEIIISGGGWARTILYPQSENKFFVREFDVQVEFIKDNTGRIKKMILYQNGNKYAETLRIE